MIEIKLDDLSLSLVNDRDTPQQGSSNVRVKIVRGDELYAGYTEEMYCMYNKERDKGMLERKGDYFIIPPECFANFGHIGLSVGLVNGDERIVTEALILQVKKTANAVVVLPTEKTWQDLVKEYVNSLGLTSGSSGGSGTNYTLPTASANTLGGVKGPAKTANDTVPISIDSNGNMYAPTYPQVSENGNVDLSAYQTKVDDVLSTTDKSITGAINELKSKIDSKAETSALDSKANVSDLNAKADASTVYTKGEIDGKVSQLNNDLVAKSGHSANKYLGTDASGNVVEKEAPQGGGNSTKHYELLHEVTIETDSVTYVGFTKPTWQIDNLRIEISNITASFSGIFRIIASDEANYYKPEKVIISDVNGMITLFAANLKGIIDVSIYRGINEVGISWFSNGKYKSIFESDYTGVLDVESNNLLYLYFQNGLKQGINVKVFAK